MEKNANNQPIGQAWQKAAYDQKQESRAYAQSQLNKEQNPVY